MEDFLSMEEIEAEQAVSLPDKEVLSLLDLNANIDLGLNLAAPIDLAAAANLNVAAPIEASAGANLVSPGSIAVGEAQQHGTVDQTMSGSATATAPQHAGVSQTNAVTTDPATGQGTGTSGVPNGDTSGATPAGDTGASAPASDTGASVPASETGASAPATGATSAPSTGDVVSSLLNGGSLLDANINVHANANLTAPIDGAVAANANVAAPVDAAVSANVLSPNSAAEAVAPQQVDIVQNLDHVVANATATQTANVNQSG